MGGYQGGSDQRRDQRRGRSSGGGAQDEDDALLVVIRRALRAQRRALRIDQRALAARAGVSKSTVARLERGDGSVALATFRRVLSGAGLALVVTHEGGVPWQEGEELQTDALGVVDRGGRGFPAHLPAAPRNSLQSWDFVRDRRWGATPRTIWRYDRWSDQLELLVREMTEAGNEAAGETENENEAENENENDRGNTGEDG